MGCESKDGFNSSTRRVIYEECKHNCKSVGFEESLTQRPCVGYAHAELLHIEQAGASLLSAVENCKKQKCCYRGRLLLSESRRARAERFANLGVEVVFMIRKLQSGKYRLYSRKKDPKTGRRRNLGTFGSRKAAEAHERAVQYYKHQ